MRKKLHRVTIFFDDKEIKRVYNAVAKEEMLPSKLLKKVVLEYLDKLETEDENFENPRPEDLAVVEDKDAIIL